ncbi:MAG TPA: hypothetical protein VJR22_04605 [Candidatus Nitrosotalea sp.]|nr:hypothetical protein [Candidatus Nitrosotalea sp.]
MGEAVVSVWVYMGISAAVFLGSVIGIFLLVDVFHKFRKQDRGI